MRTFFIGCLVKDIPGHFFSTNNKAEVIFLYISHGFDSLDARVKRDYWPSYSTPNQKFHSRPGCSTPNKPKICIFPES